MLQNVFGSVGLVRRTLIAESQPDTADGRDPAWPLYASLYAAGATIASVPEVHALGRGGRGRLADRAPEVMAVLRAYENRLPRGLAALPALAVANALRRTRVVEPPIGKRVLQVLRNDGALALVRRAARRAGRQRDRS